MTVWAWSAPQGPGSASVTPPVATALREGRLATDACPALHLPYAPPLYIPNIPLIQTELATLSLIILGTNYVRCDIITDKE